MSCYLREVACRRLIIEVPKISRNYFKNLWIFPRRRNFHSLLVTRCKFTRCSLLVVKLLPTRCEIDSLIVAEITRCKQSLVTRCKICSILVLEIAPCKNYFLLVAKIARCRKSLVTRCRIHKIVPTQRSALKSVITRTL